MADSASPPSVVKPRAISGFPEWLPAERLVEQRFLDIIRETFERFGFAPIETPAVERREVLTAKGIVDKEIYALSRLAAADDEDPSTDLALHFDLTVPTARYVAQHFNRLVFPFRRYQIQKVWRGERPQAGRFREFTQCDIDIIGNGALDLLADAEIPAVIDAVFSRFAADLGTGGFVIRLNNRKLLQGLLEAAGAATPAALAAALRAIDALEKVGRDAVAAELVRDAGLTAAAADGLLDRLAAVTDPAGLDGLAETALFEEGRAEVAQVFDGLAALGVPAGRVRLDLTIARGLDYYTGTVYETVLDALPGIGSVCSGGRYENLASTYTRQTLPGVGISIGLSRLVARAFEAGLIAPGPATPATVLVTVMDRTLLADSLDIARRLRAAGVATEVYTEPRKLAAQLKYADAKGFRYAVILGEDEKAAGTVQMKDLKEGAQTTVPLAEVAVHLG